MGGNRSHDPEDEHSGRAAVYWLRRRRDIDAVFLQDSVGGPLVDLVARPARDFPEDHHVNVLQLFYVGEHLLERLTPQHGAAGNPRLDVLADDFRAELVRLGLAALAL
ncbi:MAG: hypothetical protein JSS68_01785 [Actinobacteria bacterium]|nr:hypothetical protein [Actinomycetota bacterium]